MPRGARRQLSRRAGHAADPRRRARRARPARPRHGLRGALRRRRAPCRSRLGLSLPRPRPRDLRPRRRFRRHRRLCAEDLRALRQDPARAGRPLAHHPSARRPAIPAERRHHHRDAAPQCARLAQSRRGLRRARRPRARQDRGIFHRDAGARRHLPLRRPDPALRGHPRERGGRDPHRRRHAEDPDLCRRQVPAVDLSRRRRARHARRSESDGQALPDQVSDWLRIQKTRSVLPQRDQLLVETFPRGSRFYMVAYPVRGPAGPPDARHAADPPAGAGEAAGRPASSPPTIRSPSGGSAISASPSRAASRASPNCSTRTCSATISKPGWRRATC